jgi:hypothetical protein
LKILKTINFGFFHINNKNIKMHYFFVTIQYYIKERSVIFSTVFKSINFLTEAEIIEKAFMKK